MRRAPVRSPRSPMTTSSASWRSRATCTQSSGPMPAGSPEVSAMTRRALLLPLVKSELDVRRVAQLPQPFLVALVGLALAQGLARLQAPALRAHVARAALEHLDKVVAERRTHGLADLADLQLLVSLLELRHRVARIYPVEFAATGGRAVVGVRTRQLGKIGAAVDDALAQIKELAARLRLRDRLVGAHEDV